MRQRRRGDQANAQANLRLHEDAAFEGLRMPQRLHTTLRLCHQASKLKQTFKLSTLMPAVRLKADSIKSPITAKQAMEMPSAHHHAAGQQGIDEVNSQR